jgi:hypothetical protein
MRREEEKEGIQELSGGRGTRANRARSLPESSPQRIFNLLQLKVSFGVFVVDRGFDLF